MPPGGRSAVPAPTLDESSKRRLWFHRSKSSKAKPNGLAGRGYGTGAVPAGAKAQAMPLALVPVVGRDDATSSNLRDGDPTGEGVPSELAHLNPNADALTLRLIDVVSVYGKQVAALRITKSHIQVLNPLNGDVKSSTRISSVRSLHVAGRFFALQPPEFATVVYELSQYPTNNDLQPHTVLNLLDHLFDRYGDKQYYLQVCEAPEELSHLLPPRSLYEEAREVSHCRAKGHRGHPRHSKPHSAVVCESSVRDDGAVEEVAPVASTEDLEVRIALTQPPSTLAPLRFPSSIKASGSSGPRFLEMFPSDARRMANAVTAVGNLLPGDDGGGVLPHTSRETDVTRRHRVAEEALSLILGVAAEGARPGSALGRPWASGVAEDIYLPQFQSSRRGRQVPPTPPTIPAEALLAAVVDGNGALLPSVATAMHNCEQLLAFRHRESVPVFYREVLRSTLPVELERFCDAATRWGTALDLHSDCEVPCVGDGVSGSAYEEKVQPPRVPLVFCIAFDTVWNERFGASLELHYLGRRYVVDYVPLLFVALCEDRFPSGNFPYRPFGESSLSGSDAVGSRTVAPPLVELILTSYCGRVRVEREVPRSAWNAVVSVWSSVMEDAAPHLPPLSAVAPFRGGRL